MLYIILPAFNEEEALPILLEDIAKTCIHLPYLTVVVNDGSNDRTVDIVREQMETHNNIHLVNHEQNRGLGAALMSGFEYVLTLNKHRPFARSESDVLIRREDPDLIITLDADNTHPVDRILLLYEVICAGADLAIASRYAKGGEQHGLSVWRKILSWGAGSVMHFFFPIPGVQDYSCGYRAYRLTTLAEGIRLYGSNLIESRNFSGMVELLLKVAPFAQHITEIPLDLHYERKKGMSKMKIWATIWGYIHLIYLLKRQAWSSVEWAEE